MTYTGESSQKAFNLLLSFYITFLGFTYLHLDEVLHSSEIKEQEDGRTPRITA
jgi:hypothetical protein